MADNVLAIINTILCVFRYDASIRREDTVQVSERVGAKTSMSKDGRTSITVSENKDSPTKCKVSILDSKRKHFDSVDLSKRKTFIPETKKAIRSFGGSRVVLAASDPSDNQEGGGSQGIIVFTLWYIFIAYCYARGTLPAQMPPEPGAPPGKGGPPPPGGARQPDNLSTAGPTEVNPPMK